MSSGRRLALVWIGLVGAAVGIFTALHQIVAVSVPGESASITESLLLVVEGLATTGAPVVGGTTSAMGHLFVAIDIVGAVLGFLMHAFLVILLWELLQEKGILAG